MKFVETSVIGTWSGDGSYPRNEATSNKETNVCIVLQMVVSKPHFILRRPF